MESCHSAVVKYDNSVSPPITGTAIALSPCHPPVYTTLAQLIEIIEQLRRRNANDCSLIEIEGGDLARNALKKLLMRCDSHTDKMAVTPLKCGTNIISSSPSPTIEDLDIELKKLQQQNDSFTQEMADQVKKTKTLEQKLKSSQDKNKKFLEKNIDLTAQNRSLKDQIQILADDSKKMKEISENAKKKTKQLSEQLGRERLENGQAQIKLKELVTCKQQITDLNKTIVALRQTCLEKDRRIELIQHRKRRKRWKQQQSFEKSQTKVKETYFGYDEDDNSFSSDNSLSLSSISSLSQGTLSEEELCDEMSKEEIETNYQRLMKEHLELQRLHSILQAQSGSHVDAERENKHRTQLQTDLYNAQYRIEELQALLNRQDEEMHSCRSERKQLQNTLLSVEEKNKEAEEDKKRLCQELTEAKDQIENMDFRIAEMESLSSTDGDEGFHTLETIPEDPLEMADMREGSLTPTWNSREGTPTWNSREGAQSPEVMGQKLHEAELTASELQQKISSLQKEKLKLEDQLTRCQGDIPSLEEKEAQEVLRVKNPIVTTLDEGTQTRELANYSCTCTCTGYGDQSHSTQLDNSRFTSSGICTSSLPQNNVKTKILANHTHDSFHNDLNVCIDDNQNHSVVQSKSCDQLKSCDTKICRKQNKCCQTNKIKSENAEVQTSKQVSNDNALKDVTSTVGFSDLNSNVTVLQENIIKLQEENLKLKNGLTNSNSLEEEFDKNLNETMEAKIVDTLSVCAALQETVYNSETKERLLKDKNKLLENTVNELESSEVALRDQLEECRLSESEIRKKLEDAKHKIKELKEIILDKDMIETNLIEKVQFLEQAEIISSQKISDLEAMNQILQQRIDLKEELETDVQLVATLKDQLEELQAENDELSVKLSEMEENEEILKNNWMKVAENDANRIQALEEKVKVLENLNRELKIRLREQQDRSPMPSSSGTSIAAELTESENSQLSDDGEVGEVQRLHKRLKNMEDEMYTLEESKNAKIENLQERIAYLKENEIKLSETIIEMENEERELKSKLQMYENKGNADSRAIYEGKIKKLKSSQHDLLDRLDSMEEHEENLKTKMLEMEHSHEIKLEQYEREIAKFQEQEESLQSQVQELEKHEEELMEKCEKLQKDFSELETENDHLNNQLDSYCDREKELVESMDSLQQEKDNLEADLVKSQGRCENLEKQVSELEEENTSLTEKIEETESELDQVKVELEQLRTENDDLNERVIELDCSEQECLEKIRNIEKKNANIEHLQKKVEVLEDAEIKLMDRVTELEEIEISLREQVKFKVKTENKSTETDHIFVDDKLEVLKHGAKLTSDYNESDDNSSLSCDQSTDTCDLVESTGQGKVTGLFERLQDLETENQSLSEKLSSLQVTDAKVKQLTEKVRLLEDSEDRLMERVMELEDTEDRMKRQLAKAKNSLSVSSGFDSDFEAIEKSDDSLREKINDMQQEKEDLRDELESVKTQLSSLSVKVLDLEKSVQIEKDKLEKCEKLLCSEKENLKLTEENLSSEKSKLISVEKCLGNEKEKCISLEKLLNDEKEKCDNCEKFLIEEKERTQFLEKCLMNQKEKCEKCEKSFTDSLTMCSKLEIDLKEQSTKFSNCEKLLKEEHEKLTEVKKSEQNLSTLLENEREKHSELEKELMSTQEKLEEVQTYYENRLSHTEDMICMVEKEKDDLQQQMNKLIKEKQVLLERIDELQQSQSELSSQISSMQSSDQIDAKSTNQNAPSTSVQLTSQNQPLSTVPLHSASESTYSSLHRENIPSVSQSNDSSSIDSSITIPKSDLMNLNHKCQEMELKLKEKQESEEKYRQKIEELENQYKNMHLTNNNDIDKHATENKLLSDQITAFHEIVKEVVLDLDNTLQHEGPEAYTAAPSQTFQFAKSFPPCIDGAFRTTLIDLNRCKTCLLERLQNLTRQKNTQSISDDSRNRELLLERILQLETSERQLKEKVKNLGVTDQSFDFLSNMLDNPEDILRQRIGELERLEKHLKQQVLDLEHDREELHEIARKDKNIIHEQNVRIRELQLSEKNLKEQVNQFEASERSLYNRTEELEDKISHMEDRISELQILEMRLKELVRKYKLDEEVWLSKSQNLEVSMTELSVNEAKLRKQYQDVEKERNGLSERTSYLQSRVNELENAETSLLQKLKDQENKEISLNTKLSELHSAGSTVEQHAAELEMVNIDLSQRLDHALQENAAISQHASELQNQLAILDQQMISMKDSELKLKQDMEAFEKREKDLQKNIRDQQLKDVDLQAKVRQVEEGEAILKDKISTLQRNENRLKYRIQELESSGTHMPLDVPDVQKEKLPRRLEDCQRRILILQNQNEKLKSRLEDYQNLSTSKSAVKLPQREYQDLRSKVALLEQTEQQLDEMEQTNAQLMDVLKQLKQGPDAEGSKAQIEAAEKSLEKTNKSIKLLRQMMTNGQWGDAGPTVPNGTESLIDQQIVSNLETTGRRAERGTKGKVQMSRSMNGHPVQSRGYDEYSDVSTVSEDSVHKTVRGSKNSTYPQGWAATEDRTQLINQLVGHLESNSDDLVEEDHWRKVETLSPRAAGSARNNLKQISNGDRWIPVGKATSMYTNAKMPSHTARDEELVLGVTFPSETERYSTQNDTDSNSPLMKRRKFRPMDSTESNAPPLPQSVPPSMYPYNVEAFDALPQDMAVNEDIMLAENYGTEYAMPGSRTIDQTGGQDAATTSTLKSDVLRERISQIGNMLKNKPVAVTELSEDEDNIMVWKRKAREESRKLENQEKENKYLKEEINKLEKELEDKNRYILILERLVEQLHEILQLKDKKSDREIVQTIEAEIHKAVQELTDVGHRKLELSQDVVALNTELSKKERELVAKRNEVDSLMRELRQWQEECRTIEDMRTNALDCLHCLEMEAGEMQELEKSLKTTKDENNRLKKQLEEMKTGRDGALSDVIPLKSKINRLCQKCRQKDDLIRRLGNVLKKMKGADKHAVLLQDVRHMEAKMPTEEYAINQGHGHVPSVGDISRERSSSILSASDTQEQYALSDTDIPVIQTSQLSGRPRSADQYDHHQRSLPGQQLPLIKGRSIGYRIDKKGPKVSPGQMPKNPYFIAVKDYDPNDFSQSGRQHLELSLTEGDEVRVIGPLDNHGYYEAEVNGCVGLVPANYLQPNPAKDDLVVLHLTPQERRNRQLNSTPNYLDASPEKILQNHSQLQHSNKHSHQGNITSPRPSPRINGFLNDSLSPRSSSIHHSVQSSTMSPRYKGIPDPPTNVKADRLGREPNVVLTWSTPELNELAQSNGSQVIGYKIYLNGKVHHQVNSPHQRKSVVDKLDLSQPLRFGIQTLTTAGPVSVVTETVYHHSNRDEALSDQDEDINRVLNSGEYRTGRKRTFMGVYDYNPAQQSPKRHHNLELTFHTGDIITVYGNERPDGYYYGEINGRKGLVPASFTEEIPLTSPSAKQLSKGNLASGPQRGHKDVRQKTPR